MSPATPRITFGESAKQQNQAPQSYREDCWSAEETHALMEAWGSLHLSLNRGSLRQHQWSYVSAAVNESNQHYNRRQRTDAQCKNRIDTLKKRFKLEKAKVSSDSDYVSAWAFFSRLDYLIAGEEPVTETPVVETPSAVLSRFPVKRRSALPKRPARWLTEDKESEEGASVSSGGRRERSKSEEEAEDDDDDDERGWRTLAGAIRRLGEVYERVESMKQEKVIELEMHRMQFTKDLEYQRIRLLMDTHLQLLSRFKRSKLHHHHPPPRLDGYL